MPSYKVKFMRTTYDHILDGVHDWPSLMLPIVPVTGRRITHSGGDSYMGLTRFAKDPQRMFNFWVSAATEKVALGPKAPWVITPDQIDGHTEEWRDQHKTNSSFLLYNFSPDQPPPQRNQTSTIAAGELQLLAQAKAALADAIGMPDASLGQQSNEVSGRAINERQEEGDLATFEFHDNLALSIETIGDILCDMIPRIYDNEQSRRIILDDDTKTTVELNHTIRDADGREHIINKLGLARYSSRTKVGPAMTTQREEFVKTMTELNNSFPEAVQLFIDFIFQNLDFPDARAAAKRAKLIIPPHLLSEEDKQGIPPKEPTPEEQLEAKRLEVEMEELKTRQIEAQDKVEHAASRVQQQETSRQFEVEKGLNRQEEKEGDSPAQVSPEEIQKMIDQGIAKAMAAQKNT